MIATGSAEAVSVNNIFPSTIVSDAFEAVTNGMHNPEAIDLLFGDESADPDWLNLIRAIQAFYRQDFEKMNSLISEIQPQSVPGRLQKVLYHMSGLKPADGELSTQEERLARRITEDSRFLTSAVSELRESMEYGEELFTETVSLLIKEIKKNSNAAASLALWAFRTSQDKGFDDEALADNILMLFGQAEGLRLIGLSLIESEPESALICFTRSLIKKLIDRSISREETAAYLEIIGALIQPCAGDDPVLIDISEMLTMLEAEIELLFALPRRSRLSSPADRISALTAALNCTPPPAPGTFESADASEAETAAADATPIAAVVTPAEESESHKPKKTRTPANEAVQLELF